MTDLKPSNIMLERLGGGRLRPVVMDFGLARDSGASVSQGLTESGAVIGTPAYMSPEQARGEARRLDRRSDVYSLGATLYDLLSGKPPFQDETVVNLLLKVMNDSPAPLRSQLPDVPEALDLIVSKCLNKEAEQRYPTALAFAQDLDRFLSAGRVQARRLGYLYRLRYFSKRNRALSALALALIVGGIASIAVVIRNHVQNLRRDAEAKAEAALAQTLGQSVKDLEWLVRTAYLLPLHDTSYEKGLVRQRMAAIHKDLQTAGEKGVRLGAYVLGRGHLALHEWDAAYEQLSRAEKLGYRDAGLDFALGRVLGEKYSRALDEARKSGDKTFVEKRKKELEKEFLFPARSYLVRSRGQTTESPSYVEALLDFYNDHHDAALLNAYMARKQAPWLYEAAKLEGDVHMLRALAQRDHGDNASAEASFAQAVARYEEAAAIGHSDHQVHEALAEAWIRQEEMDLYRGIDPTPKMQKALTAADHAIEAAPKESYGYTKKAFAYGFVVQYLQRSGDLGNSDREIQKAILVARYAVKQNPSDPFALNTLGILLRISSEIKISNRINADNLLTEAYSKFQAAIRINPTFPVALSDYAGTLIIEAQEKLSHNINPTQFIAQIDKLCHIAISLDPGHLNAYIMIYIGRALAARWNAEHGIPINMDELTNSVININQPPSIDQHPLLIWNRGIIFQYTQRINADIRTHNSKITDKIRDLSSQLSTLFPEMPEAYNLIAELDLMNALSKLEQNINPSPDIDNGLKNANLCISKGGAQSTAMRAECKALFLFLELLSFMASGSNSLTRLELALLEIASLAKENLLNDKIQITCADMYTYAMSSRNRINAKLSNKTIIARGIACVEQALALAPQWPRAMAFHGSLLMRESARPAEQILVQARSAFRDAFIGNPNLKNRFGETAKEVERKLAELEAGR